MTPDAATAPGQQIVVRCEGLRRTFGTHTALDGVDLEVPAGRVVGYLGPNGAGKTTTIRLLLGLLAPTDGRVEVFGLPLPEHGDEVRRRTGVVLDRHGLYEGLTCRQALRFHGRTLGMDRSAADARVEQVVGELGLAERLDDRPDGLSRGMRQRMAVARALLGRPDLLVLDEPTTGLDPEAAATLRRQVRRLADRGTTVLLTTHQLAEAEQLCDQVAVVVDGRVAAQDTPERLRARAQVREVRCEGDGVREAAAAALDPPWRDDGPEAVVVAVDGADRVPSVVDRLVGAGARLRRVEPRGQTLEAAVLAIAGGARSAAEWLADPSAGEHVGPSAGHDAGPSADAHGDPDRPAGAGGSSGAAGPHTTDAPARRPPAAGGRPR